MATGVSKSKWNGEINEHLNNIGDSVTLSYQGRKSVQDVLTTNPANFVELIKGRSDHRLYFGDNLAVLSALLADNDVKGKVKLVYIDPPFSTKSVFQSRNQDDAYEDLLSGSHYLEFIRERLILLKELMSEDGSIYVHLDDKMAFYVKVLMDEIFGSKNFRNWITRKKCNPKNYTSKVFGNISDYILFYTTSEKYIWNRPFDKWTDEHAYREYSYIEEGTGRRYKKVPIHAPGTRRGETGKPWRGKLPPPGKHWQFSPATLDEMDARGEIFWSSNDNPRRKVYLDESKGIPIQDIWLDYKDAHNQNIRITGYPTEKNPDLLDIIIKTSSNPGDLVLDCFSGSGTTLEVANKNNRLWIGIDNSSVAISTTLKIFFVGSERMGDYVNPKNHTQLTLVPYLPDFQLLATEPYQHELDQDIDQWQNYISKHG